ncbi:response regulator transcription factor [Leifsonia bigeumensis]|uniref:Response regulator transcription factor n=2 Tax=Leifsonella bigeumensis TaxID=433643 RepID=A0ABP7FR28_9MICO
MGELLSRGLTADGYEVDLVADGVDALITSAKNRFAVAVVDVMLPGMTGYELCRRLKESDDAPAVLLLTARNSVEDRVFGLDSGADDYLTKPFAFAELSARLRALLRRGDPTNRLRLTVGRLELDSLAMVVSLAGRPVALSPKEFALLRLLAMNLGTLVSRNRILEEVWGGTAHIDANIVDQYTSYLRRKLGSRDTGVHITTVRGEGYILEASA